MHHEAVSRLVEGGLSDQEVSAISGYRSMQITSSKTLLPPNRKFRSALADRAIVVMTRWSAGTQIARHGLRGQLSRTGQRRNCPPNMRAEGHPLARSVPVPRR
ncbi:hypothetical protein PLA107_002075 [Pseudomonas amygdali pv. lachrymans str. M301315]|uniref:Uncharacterized protein n=1 Tax=Pseudomonas amygdali pv. lachrymans str. M301315 TaxID=629260 RepID=A0AAD0LTU6_PSEAV|nr:hypothetical protein B5U27_25920 [Pseudomonas amygdali pv. lachrymans]AXH54247.1 hypothetical protein PLA107_002075 [Pseudomonas amygdali pv. lachrymans str. M301315]PWD01561.1 hypothetical protein CX658_16310 [Pseudomonas amygdali pv. lachrymans]